MEAREDIEKVRDNEDKESDITNIEVHEEKRRRRYIYIVYIWSFMTIFLFFYTSRICNLLKRSTTVPRCLVTLKRRIIFKSLYLSLLRVP